SASSPSLERTKAAHGCGRASPTREVGSSLDRAFGQFLILKIDKGVYCTLHTKMGGEAEKREKTREDRRLREMDELGSEVFNLKLAMQEYEERLAKLYQTEDRSQWRGPATILADLEAADRQVDRLENTVASLRHQLHVSRGGGGGGGGGGGIIGSSDGDEGEDRAQGGG
ncbi:unnamed protein product, partial [Scytosiphon promiscuus]